MTRLFLIGLSTLFIISGCNPGPTEKPAVNTLTGIYRLSSESKRFLKNHKSYKAIPNSEIALHTDSTFSITGLPDCYVDGFGNGNGRFLTGQGTWEIESVQNGFRSRYGVTLTVVQGGTMKPGIYHGSSILIEGRTPPFKLQFGIGDPDQDEYIVYEKTNS